jgi:mannose-6-phosphate isomerase-like protein (cupin superfamily)
VPILDHITEPNTDFRHALYTGKNLQLVVMSLKPGEDIGVETHATHDQFFRVEKGKGEVVIDAVTQKVKSGTSIVVSAGALHNLINIGNKEMKVFAIHAPPNHVDQIEQKTKSLAQASSEHFDGKVTG